MKALLFILFVFAFNPIVLSQDIYICKDGEMSFFSEAPLEDIDATTTKTVSALNVKTRKIVFKVSIKSFQFKKSMMQEHFNEKKNFMHSSKYPYASFNGQIIDEVDLTQDGTYEVTVQGKLTIKGVEQERKINAVLVVNNGAINGKAEFVVKVEDYNIKIPKLLFKNIAEEVLVKINVNYKPKNA